MRRDASAVNLVAARSESRPLLRCADVRVKQPTSITEERTAIIMPIFRRGSAGLVLSSALALGLFYTAAPTLADSSNVVMLANTQTGKCLTIAGGVSTENNVEALQFTCDSHPSRTWRIIHQGGGNIDDN
jgi:Ricin-type beta-trefoil lectin domain-like